MKYKILIILIAGVIITSGIYYNIDKSKLNILSLGDGISTGMTAYHVEGYDFNDYLVEYLKQEKKLDTYYRLFNEIDETAINLINKIENNVVSLNSKIKIKQSIKNADIITIALGMDELNNYATKNYLGSTKINGFLNKYKQLLKIIRTYNDKNIYVVSLYATNKINKEKMKKINQELELICKEFHVTFVSIENITEEITYFPIRNNYYPNYKGQYYIFEKIKHNLEGVSTIKII